MNSLPAITFVEETGSTNADLAAALRDGTPPREGEWLVARRQTAGRGRQGREWQDGAGNFMGSTVVEVRDCDPPPASLAFASALAVAAVTGEALRSATRIGLKWPNDVVIEGAKLAGLLLQMVDRRVVVGIGVNLVHGPKLPDRETTALANHGAVPPLEKFAERMARTFASELARWRSEGLEPTLQRFLAASIHQVGGSITVHDTDGSRISGTFAGLDPVDGALRLRLADGAERAIRAGDIR